MHIKQVGSVEACQQFLNAANEKAVALFLDRKIQFLDIYDIIEDTMNAHKVIENPTLEEVLETEQWVYEHIESR